MRSGAQPAAVSATTLPTASQDWGLRAPAALARLSCGYYSNRSPLGSAVRRIRPFNRWVAATPNTSCLCLALLLPCRMKAAFLLALVCCASCASASRLFLTREEFLGEQPGRGLKAAAQSFGGEFLSRAGMRSVA